MRPKRRLAVTYLLEAAPMFGGVKVVLRQADLLHRRGHRVAVAIAGDPPDWYRPEAEVRRVPGLDPQRLPAGDVVVATYWTTIAAAVAAAGSGARAVHYCQGLEYTYTHNRADHERILAAYRAPLPAFTVSAHLSSELRRRFGRPSRVVAQPLEPEFRAERRWRPGEAPRVLLCGPFEIDWKGVTTGLEAVELLRRGGQPCRLVRLSQWPSTDAERAVLAADEFHCGLRSEEVADLVRGCDLLLAPSWEQEGFGLPALEAMASGVPVVASDVACYRSWAADAAALVPVGDAAAMAAAAGALLADGGAWRQARRRGLRLARSYRESRATTSAEAALRWALAPHDEAPDVVA